MEVDLDLIDLTGVTRLLQDWTVQDQCTVRSAASGALEPCGQAPNTSFRFPDLQRTSLVSEFQLVCGRRLWAQHGTSLFMAGGLVSTPLITQAADRYGRRLTFLLPLWLTVLSNIGCGLAPDYRVFLALRFVAGLGTAVGGEQFKLNTLPGNPPHELSSRPQLCADLKKPVF